MAGEVFAHTQHKKKREKTLTSLVRGPIARFLLFRVPFEHAHVHTSSGPGGATKKHNTKLMESENKGPFNMHEMSQFSKHFRYYIFII